MKHLPLTLALLGLGGVLADDAKDGKKPPEEKPVEKEKKDPFQDTFHSSKEAMGAMQKREPSAPKAGQPAPDFVLRDPEGKSEVRLSAFKGKSPVILLFGSYT